MNGFTSKLLEDLIYSIEESKIVNYNFDLMNKKIIFDLQCKEYGKVSNHVLCIEEVTSFYHVDDPEIIYDENSYLELTSLCLDNAFINITGSHKDWLKHYSSSINICIEIWEEMLLIKARRIIIDGKTFDL